MQKKFMILFIIMILAYTSVLTVHAGEHYDVYHYDRWGEAIPSQAGYSAVRSVRGKDLGIEDFSEPSDICRNDNQFFIVDTKNNRIVVTNSDLTRIIRVMKLYFWKPCILSA